MARRSSSMSKNHTLGNRLLKAFYLLEHGKLVEASDLFQQELLKDPEQASCLVGMALIHLKSNDYANALTLLKKATSIEPEHPLANRYLGIVYFELGEWKEAKPLIALLAEQESNPYHWRNLAYTQWQLGEIDQAITSYQQALESQPDFYSAQLELAQLLQSIGKYSDASQHFQAVIATRPELEAAQLGYAFALQSQGKDSEALEHLTGLLVKTPDYPAVQIMIAAILQRTGETEEAKECLEQVLAAHPRHIAVLVALANLYYTMGEIESAAQYYRDILAIEPNLTALINLANIAIAQRDWADAKYLLGQALTLAPSSATALTNLGTVYHQQGDFENEMSCYTAALTQYANQRVTDLSAEELFFGFQACKYNLGRLQLLQGDMSNGWVNFQARKHLFPGLIQLLPNVTYFDGKQNPAQQTVYLLCEQEFTHTIACLRFALLLKKLQANTVLIAPKTLAPLCTKTPGVDCVETSLPSQPIANSLQVSVVDIPFIFSVDPQQMEPLTPYLHVADSIVATSREKLSSTVDLHVGVCWQFSPTNQIKTSTPTITATKFCAIIQRECCGYYLIGTRISSPTLPKDSIWQDWSSDSHELLEVASSIKTLDLVITIDNSMAHLCGALNVPCWLLLPDAPDWYWQLKGKTSPWYPSVQLFRATAFGDWADVEQQVIKALKTLKAGGDHA